MAKNIKKYSPSNQELSYAKFAYENDLAICLKPVPDTSNYFWVEKHLISDCKVMQFLRKDQAKKDLPDNRMVFNEVDGLKKCFEMYKMFYETKNNS